MTTRNPREIHGRVSLRWCLPIGYDEARVQKERQVSHPACCEAPVLAGVMGIHDETACSMKYMVICASHCEALKPFWWWLCSLKGRRTDGIMKYLLLSNSPSCCNIIILHLLWLVSRSNFRPLIKWGLLLGKNSRVSCFSKFSKTICDSLLWSIKRWFPNLRYCPSIVKRMMS